MQMYFSWSSILSLLIFKHWSWHCFSCGHLWSANNFMQILPRFPLNQKQPPFPIHMPSRPKKMPLRTVRGIMFQVICQSKKSQEYWRTHEDPVYCMIFSCPKKFTEIASLYFSFYCSHSTVSEELCFSIIVIMYSINMYITWWWMTKVMDSMLCAGQIRTC